MALEIVGSLIKKRPVQSGTSARGEWQKQEFIIKTQDNFPKEVCFNVWGADKVAELEADGYTIVSQETMTTEEVEFDITAPVTDSQASGSSDMIVVGGPAVNEVAADLLGLSFPTYDSASGVNEGEAVIRFFESENSVLVYGWSAADTKAAADKFDADKLYPCTNCGMAPLPREVARGKLQALAAGADIIRKEIA